MNCALQSATLKNMFVFGGTLFVLSGITLISAFNIDTTIFSTVEGPKKDMLFGYSIAATDTNGSLTLWSGSPKFSNSKGTDGGPKVGAIYRCSMSASGDGIEQSCEKINLKSVERGEDEHQITDGAEDTGEDILPETALEHCPFINTSCEYTVENNSLWLTRKDYETFLVKKTKHVNRKNRNCYPRTELRTRLTGPPSYTIHEGLIALDSDAATRRTASGQSVVTRLVSQPVRSRIGVTQCLHFCYNAYSLFDNTAWSSRRSLRVFLQYENFTNEIFVYRGPEDVASKYWNFTEINIDGTLNGYYKVVFQVTVFKGSRRQCAAAADIVLNDISVSNVACEDEPDNIDIYDSEKSVGISLQVNPNSDNDETSSITACGPLWQKNCGYAREAAGICYEMTSNSTRIKVNTLHNPASTGCIRGKIDVILLVDQSGSVNQCNFQKVKQWLRNIVRGFTVGQNEQDIGIVLYSSEENTKNVFQLGFENYNNDGDEKKRRMLQDLKKLEYPAGATFTGLAFKRANEMLWGPLARPEAKKMVILLTDGDTTAADKPNLQKQVKITRSRNATILAVGVADYNPSELINISGNARNFFPVKDFSQLELVRDKLRESVSHSVLEGSHDHELDSGSMQNCLMGFSLHYGKEFLLMGSPGCHNRAGDVLKYNTAEMNDGKNVTDIYGLMDTLHINQTNTTPYIDDVGHFQLTSAATDLELTTNRPNGFKSSMPNDTHNHEPRREPTMSYKFEIPSFEELERAMHGQMDESYFGYDVSSGYYRGIAMGEFVAASAPRNNVTGSVLVFQSYLGDKIKNDHLLAGAQLGEYFGASVRSIDINSDGYTDLFVAAPLHSAENPDEGRVYVYLGRTELSSDPDFTLKGSGAAFSRFGTSVNPVDDLNLDGYDDIVISSPNEEDGSGVVYVFHGAKAGVHRKYVQRIAASHLNKEPPLALFGQGVVGGVDVDKNGYPDLLVSAPGSDAIVFLKTRPVILIESKFRISTPLIDRRNKLCWQQENYTSMDDTRACIMCSACFAYGGLSVTPGIAVRYEIFADAMMPKSRVSFYGTKDSGRIIHNDVTIWNPDAFVCRNHTLFLKKNVQDMMTELVLRLTFDMDEGTPPSPGILTPILDNTHTVKKRDASARFKTYCEDTSSCVSDISVTTSGPVNEEGKPVLDYIVNEEKILRFNVEVENFGPEDAHALSVTVQFDSALIYNSLTKTTCFKIMDQRISDENGFQSVVMMLKSTLLAKGDKCDGMLIFLASNQIDPQNYDNLTFQVDAKTVSIDNKTLNNKKTVTVTLRYKAEFVISGSSFPNAVSIGILNATNDTSATTSFEHVYSITNVGPTGMRRLKLFLEWPVCVQQNNMAFHVKYIGDKFCSRMKSYGTCRNITTRNETLLSSNEEICLEEHSEKSESTTLSHTIELEVENFPVHWNLQIAIKGEIESRMFVNLKGQLFVTSSLSLDLARRDLLTFPSGQAFSTETGTAVYPPIAYTQIPVAEKVTVLPFWVYIVSIGVGLLLLIILLFVLRQVGFFKSKYADKKREAQEDMLYSSERVPMNVET